MTYLLLQSLYSLAHRVSPYAQRLTSHLLNLFELAHGPDVGVRALARPKLADTSTNEAAFGIVTWAGVLSRTSGENSGLALGKSGRGSEEDELVAGWKRHGETIKKPVALSDEDVEAQGDA